MGIFKGLQQFKEQIDRNRQEREIMLQKQREARAETFIQKEGIKCISNMDLEAIKLIVKAYDDNSEPSFSSSISLGDEYGSLDNNAIRTVDQNLHHFCEAIIQQNFMLMRKIEDLSNKIEIIENQVNQEKRDGTN